MVPLDVEPRAERLERELQESLLKVFRHEKDVSGFRERVAEKIACGN